MRKQIKDLSDSDCQDLFEAIMQNSERRWQSAELLANNQDYGGAIRDLITSMEEMIKSIIMLADTKGFEFRKIENMDFIIRRSHSIRHLIGLLMLIFNIFIDDFKKVIEKFHESPSEFLLIVKNKPFVETLLKKYLVEKIIIFQEEFKWFSKVEITRQQSTHVDLGEEIISPISLTSDDYQEVFSRMNNVKKLGSDFISSLTSDDKDFNQQLADLQKQFIDEDWYETISSFIESTKNGKKNPFGLIEKKMNDLDFNIDEIKL